MVDREWIRKHILDLNDDEIARIEKGRETDKLREMELEAIQLPQAEDAAFGGEGGEGEEAAGGGDPFGGGEGGGDEGGGGLGDLFAGELRSGGLMSEEDFAEVDKLLEEDEDLEESDEKDDKDKKTNKKHKRKISLSKQLSGRDVGYKNPITALDAGGSQAIKQLNKISAPNIDVFSTGLMDGVMPQSPVVSDFVDKKLSYRMSKDFESMSSSLNLGIKSNTLLKESSNHEDYDIVIDDDLFSDTNKEEE